MNKLLRILGLYFVLLAAGCSTSVVDDTADFVDDTVDYVLPIDHYTIVIDSSLSVEQRDIFLQAVDDWKKILGDTLGFSVVLKEFDHAEEPNDGEIRVYGIVPPNESTAAGMTKPWKLRSPWKFTDSEKPVKSRIWFDKTPKDPTLFRMVCQHEVGHALGLVHNDNMNSVMHWYLPSAEKNYITCSDVRALCGTWGCKPKTCFR